jgi:hypothetical protein
MKPNNVSRELPKFDAGTAAPVTYRSTAAVYRSLAAVPAQFDAAKHHARDDKFEPSLVGPQAKSQGAVIWTARDVKRVDQEPQPVPIPLIVANAPHNTLYLESNPVSKVVAAVHALFDQQAVDFAYSTAKFKWKCACYDGLVETRFVSKLFSVPDKANYFVLDFQRRSGDPFHFNSIYKAINFKLLKLAFVVPCGDSKTSLEPKLRTFRPLPLPDDFFAGENVSNEDQDSMEFEPLRKMCVSPYIDVQREGLAALANYVGNSEFARTSLLGFAGKLMEMVVSTRDVHVRRLAIATLAGLTVDPASHSHIKDTAGLRVIASIFLSPNELPETRRQAAKLLSNMPVWDQDTTNLIKRAHIASDAPLADLFGGLQGRLN